MISTEASSSIYYDKIKKNRLREIDFLRGVAVILVLFRHKPVFNPLTKAGWIGVDLFFVLSGFLVSGLLFMEYKKYGSVNVAKFLIRRGFKIYPLFYFAIILTICLNLVSNIWIPTSLNSYNVLSELFFVQNYFGALWNHTWSLAVEEHFYLILAISIFLITKTTFLSNPLSVTSSIFFFLILCLVLRFINYELNPYTLRTHQFPTHLRMDSLLFGVLISYFYCFYNEKFKEFIKKYSFLLIFASISCLSLPFIFRIDSFTINTFGLTLIYIGCGSVLSLFVSYTNTNAILNRFLNRWFVDLISYIGFYSYGIYLFHMIIIRYGFGLLDYLQLNFDYRLEFIVFLALSVFAGVFFSKLIESKFLKIRDVYFS